MLLRAKKLAFLGLLLAVAVLLVILGGILDFNTLFLLAAASFCIGIAIREHGLRLGFGFFLASVILSVLLAPNKLYCITYAAMGLYLVLTEFIWLKLASGPALKVGAPVKRKPINRARLFWILKFIIFNIIYIPLLLLAPQLIYQGKILLNFKIFLLLFTGGQAALIIYDRAYYYFQSRIWGKFRRYFIT